MTDDNFADRDGDIRAFPRMTITDAMTMAYHSQRTPRTFRSLAGKSGRYCRRHVRDIDRAFTISGKCSVDS